MKKLLITTALIAACTLSNANAAATLDAPEVSAAEQLTKDAFKKGDTDNDGFISKTEHASMMDAMFTEADTNSDGKLSMDEVKAEKTKMAKDVDMELGKSTTLSPGEMQKIGALTKKAFMKGDTDNDNFISKSEHATMGEKMFADADSNSDGKLSMDEVKTAKTKMLQEVKMEKADDVKGNVNTKNQATK